MYIDNREETGIVGKDIRLSTQELIALKDKWFQIEHTIDGYTGNNGEVNKKHSREVMNTLLPLIGQMDVFITQIVEDVQSLQEAHDTLFISDLPPSEAN